MIALFRSFVKQIGGATRHAHGVPANAGGLGESLDIAALKKSYCCAKTSWCLVAIVNATMHWCRVSLLSLSLLKSVMLFGCSKNHQPSLHAFAFDKATLRRHQKRIAASWIPFPMSPHHAHGSKQSLLSFRKAHFSSSPVSPSPRSFLSFSKRA